MYTLNVLSISTNATTSDMNSKSSRINVAIRIIMKLDGFFTIYFRDLITFFKYVFQAQYWVFYVYSREEWIRWITVLI